MADECIVARVLVPIGLDLNAYPRLRGAGIVDDGQRGAIEQSADTDGLDRGGQVQRVDVGVGKHWLLLLQALPA